MKLFHAALILGALALTGCASMNSPKLLTPLTKVTLFSVVANDQVYYYGDKPPEANAVSALLNTASNDGKANAVTTTLMEKTDVMLSKAEVGLMAVLGSAWGTTLTPKETLFASKTYSGTKDEMFTGFVQLKPTGYKFVKLGDAVLSSSLAKELGVNGLISANFLFQKHLTFGVAGNGVMESLTTMTINAYDASGKLVFTNSYLGKSKDTEAVVGGLYDFGKFQDLTSQATADALQKFATDLAAR